MFYSAKRWDRGNRADLIKSATPCHDSPMVGSCGVLNPLGLTVLAAKSEDYTTVPQHLLRSHTCYLSLYRIIAVSIHLFQD